MGTEWDGEERRHEVRREADRALMAYLHKLSRRLTVVIVAAAVTVIWMYVQNRHRSQAGQEAHSALCVFKADLIKRAQLTDKLLQENPNGVGGITAKVLRNSSANQHATIDSLSILDCGPIVEGSPK